ncbi:hypothetical protein O3M35_011098 [Rhynocoris fuscipes]|uniref:Uncharacterized protein n=1 Tax=Rhynocoris fuscipes TaxID=488301 RepID=A0AAW1CXN0_9HEMI
MFDQIPEIEAERVEKMKTLKKKYFNDEGMDEGKTAEFPSFTFQDKPLDSIDTLNEDIKK